MDILTIAQLIVCAAVIVLILIQDRSTGGIGVFGGGDGGGFYQARRGFEKMIFVATMVLSAAFAALALLNLVV